MWSRRAWLGTRSAGALGVDSAGGGEAGAGGGGAAETLDQTYDAGSKTITLDAGAIVLDGSTGTSSIISARFDDGAAGNAAIDIRGASLGANADATHIGLKVSNATAATAGATQQNSPTNILSQGEVWNGSASQTVALAVEHTNIGVGGSGPRAQWLFRAMNDTIGSGAWRTLFGWEDHNGATSGMQLMNNTSAGHLMIRRAQKIKWNDSDFADSTTYITSAGTALFDISVNGTLLIDSSATTGVCETGFDIVPIFGNQTLGSTTDEWFEIYCDGSIWGGASQGIEIKLDTADEMQFYAGATELAEFDATSITLGVPLETTGGLCWNTTNNASATYTSLQSDEFVYNTGANATITLVTQPIDGTVQTFYNDAVTNLTIAAGGADAIDGGGFTIATNGHETVIYKADNATWYRIG